METAVAAIAIATISWLMLGGSSKEDKPKPPPPSDQEYELIIRPKKK
jgi:hypothetical protein